MSNKNTKIFLCCFCGIIIKTHRYNLDLHEKLHGEYISKIQCAAKKCKSSFADKRNYWNHWARYHKEMVMPDILIHSDEPNTKTQAKRATTVKSKATKKAKQLGCVKHVKNAMKSVPGEKRNVQNDAGERGNSSDLISFNIEKTIEDCLLRDPFYGHLVT